jgi:hypothetical protein
MASESRNIRILHASTVLLSTTLCGLNLGLSTFVIPRLLEAPSPLMLRQWNNMYQRTSRFFPPPVLSSAASYWFIAYTLRNVPFKSRLLVLAGAFCFTLGPWTKLVMTSINNKLFKKVEDTRDMGIMAVAMTKEEEESAKYLVDQWGLYNLGRTVGIGLGSIIGMLALIS